MFCQTIKAQHGNILVEYNRLFSINDNPTMVDKKSIPVSFNNHIEIGYSHHFKNSSPLLFRINVGLYSGSNTNTYIKKYSTDNKFDFDFTKNSKAEMGFTLTGGVQYFLPSLNLPFRLSFGSDAEVFMGNGSQVDYYLGSQSQPTLARSVKSSATQFVYKPFISMTRGFRNNFAINLRIGYNNLGGISVGGGLSLAVKGKGKDKPKEPHWCCMCGWHPALCKGYPIPD